MRAPVLNTAEYLCGLAFTFYVPPLYLLPLLAPFPSLFPAHFYLSLRFDIILICEPIPIGHLGNPVPTSAHCRERPSVCCVKPLPKTNTNTTESVVTQFTSSFWTPLRAMAVVSLSGMLARTCHRVGVVVAADLLAVWQSVGRCAYITSLLSVMMYQLSCIMADVLRSHGTGSCVTVSCCRPSLTSSTSTVVSFPPSPTPPAASR